jgi:osmoprotectant transport system permease protein
VSSISLVSVGSLLGDSFGGLGYFFTRGYQIDYPTEIWTGVIAVVVLALAADLVLVAVGRLLTPWVRRSPRTVIRRRTARAQARAA